MAVNTEQRAKLVRSGSGQAVRLPKNFEFAGHEVKIRRVGDGVVLEPVTQAEEKPDWSWLHEIQGKFDDSFFEAIEEGRREQTHQERPELDKLFP